MPTSTRKTKRVVSAVGATLLALSAAAGIATLHGALPAAPSSAQEILPPGEIQKVESISSDGREFTRAFNAAADQTRVVLVFSPT